VTDQTIDVKALHDAARCPKCGGSAVVWYSGGFGCSWWEADYGRCALDGVVDPPSVSDVVRAAYEEGKASR